MGTGYYGKKAMANSRFIEEPIEHWFYRRCLGWQLKFALWPRRCDLTKKLIWFNFGYRGTAVLTGPGDDIVEQRWHDKHEHIIWRLKG